MKCWEIANKLHMIVGENVFICVTYKRKVYLVDISIYVNISEIRINNISPSWIFLDVGLKACN